MQGRQLGYWESACALIHDELNATGLMFTRIQVEGKINLDEFRVSFHKIFLRHPLLRATIGRGQTHYFLQINCQFENIPITSHALQEEKRIERFIESELKKPLSIHEYLWKAALFSKNGKHEIILFFHHSIADGLSSVQFTHELLENLADPGKSRLEEIKSLPLLDPIEKLVNPFLKQEKPIENNDLHASKIHYACKAEVKNRTTKNIFKIIQCNELNKIKQACKKHGITINSYFNATLFISLMDFLKENSILNVITPVNLRSYAAPEVSSEHIGCYMTCVSLNIALNKNSDCNLFELAKQYQEQLSLTLSSFSKLPEELNLQNLEVISGLVDIEYADKRDYFPAGVAVTNKGRASLNRHFGQLKLLGYFTASSRQAGDLALNLSLTTIEDEVYCCFTYTEPLMKVEIIRQVVENFMGLHQLDESLK